MAPVAVGEAQAPPDPPFLPPLRAKYLKIGMNMHHFFHGISTTNAHAQLICGLTDYVELVTIVAVPPFFRFRERPPLILGHRTMNLPYASERVEASNMLIFKN